MSELLAQHPDGAFHRLIQESVEGREMSGPSIAVLAIGGTEGSGRTTTGKMIQKIAHEREGIHATFISAGDEVETVRKSITGYQTQSGYFQRDPEVDRQINLKMAANMIAPEHDGSLVIVEGRLAPYIARRLQRAAQDLDLPLPAEIVNVYLTTRDREVGYWRKYADALRDNPTIDRDEFFEEMKNKTEQDLASVWRTYPELTGVTPYSFNFQIGGKGVYDLRYDTAAYDEGEIAQQILATPKVEKLLSILPRHEKD